MHKIEDVTDEPHQRHILIMEDASEAVIEIRFLPAVQMWTLSASYNGRSQSGLKLSAAAYHLISYGFPFDITVSLTDDSGISPFRVDDFSTGRAELYFITPVELAMVRGQL